MTVSQPADISASWLPALGTIIRGSLILAGASGATWARAVTGSDVEQLAGATAVAVGYGWGIWQKFQANRALRVAAANPVGMTPPALPL